MQGDSIISGYLDNRAGCAVLIQTAKIISEEITKGTFPEDREIYFVFTVQEEVGLRGAGPAAYGIHPDYAIVVDVTGADDVLGKKAGSVSLGAGPVIKVKDERSIAHPYIKEKLKSVAEEAATPYQFGVSDKGGTDAGVIHITRGGIITGGLSIATRYIHSPGEICNINDLKSAAWLLAEFGRICETPE